MRNQVYIICAIATLILMGTFCTPATTTGNTSTVTTQTSTTASTLTSTTASTLTSSTTTLSTTTVTTVTTTSTTITTTTLTSTTTTLCFGGCDGVVLFGSTAGERPRNPLQTSDGGFILSSNGQSVTGVFSGEPAYGGNDIGIVKLDTYGQFDSSFDGNGIRIIGGNSADDVIDILQTADGGYLLTGWTNSTTGDFAGQGSTGNYIYILIKLTASGAFDTSFGGGDGIITYYGTGDFGAYSIIQTLDGGYMIAGEGGSADGDFAGEPFYGGYDAQLIKLTSTGALDTSFDGNGIKTFGGSANEEIYDVVQLPDSSYVATGYTRSSNGDFTGQGYMAPWNDVFVVKLTPAGAFDTSFAGDGILLVNGTNDDTPGKLCKTSDGGFLISGQTSSTDGTFAGEPANGNYDAFIVKLTSVGVFDTSFSGNGMLFIGSSSSNSCKTIETSTGKYLSVVSTDVMDGTFAGHPSFGGADQALVSLNTDGSIDTSFATSGILTFGGSGGDYSDTIIEGADGHFYIDGYTNSTNGTFSTESPYGVNDIYLIRINPAGMIDGTF